MRLGHLWLAACLTVFLSGCEDREAAMARCRMEAIKTASDQGRQIAYARDCMVLAGYRYDASLCAGYGPLAIKCYAAHSIGAQLSELFSW